MINLIVAVDENYGIGKENSIPWELPGDLKYFKEITTSKKRNVVIMGRKTWESIPIKYRPLKDRINIVITSQKSDFSVYPNTYAFKTLGDATKYIQENNYKLQFGNTFIIGGQMLYNEALNTLQIDNIYLTRVYGKFECDKTFMDKKSFYEKINNYVLSDVSPFKCENEIYYRFFHYTYKDGGKQNYYNFEENQFLGILRKILDEGIERDDRTGTGTLATFGERQEYDLTDTFPLLTTKRIFTRAVFEELMMYLRGDTDNKILTDKNIHIWDGNTNREFLDSRGLTEYPEGDMGETYGFNFRHFGGEYKDCHTQYEKGNGFDQVENAIHLIKNDPCSRRIIISLWNPNTNHKASLPSCLCWYQFFVDTKRDRLNLQIYIRSSDFFLANNWNVCTGAFLVNMICNLEGVNLTPGKIICITGDTHVYKNHIEQAHQNLERSPRPFPKLVIKEKKKTIEEFQWEDMCLVGYDPMPNIKAEMSA
jgi:dihydrofolate reductase / thymidylate synthase